MALQAGGPAQGVVGVAGRAAGAGLGAEGGAERFPAGADATGGGTQCPEGNQPEPGPQPRSPHQPVPGINQMQTYKHGNVSTIKGCIASQYRQYTILAFGKKRNVFTVLLSKKNKIYQDFSHFFSLSRKETTD